MNIAYLLLNGFLVEYEMTFAPDRKALCDIKHLHTKLVRLHNWLDTHILSSRLHIKHTHTYIKTIMYSMLTPT